MRKKLTQTDTPLAAEAPRPLVTTDEVAGICARCAQAPFIAVDFEFMRESTYYPLLCLIQLATAEEAWIIDPLADDIDLAPFYALMTDSAPIKLFHAGSQDIEIIVNATGRTPEPVFDTQIAAMALGYGDQVGYQPLVSQVLGRQLDKGARFTDWSRRPLDERQLSYAIGDVTHLAEMFPILVDKLRRRERGDWLDEEMIRLADPASYIVDPETVWRRLKLPSRKADVLGRLKALAAWRERAAQARDLPRNRLMKDETLADLASNPPRDQAALARVRGLSEKWASNEMGARLMEALAGAQPLSPEEMPAREAGPMDARVAAAADLLRLLLKLRAAEAGVAPRLIARADELDALARGDTQVPVMSGWRYEQFGRDARDIVEGRIGFAFENGKLRTIALAKNADD